MTVLNGIVDIMGTKVDPPAPRCSPNLNPLPDPNLTAAREALKRPRPWTGMILKRWRPRTVSPL
jgi:hypothetical protein